MFTYGVETPYMSMPFCRGKSGCDLDPNWGQTISWEEKMNKDMNRKSLDRSVSASLPLIIIIIHIVTRPDHYRILR